MRWPREGKIEECEYSCHILCCIKRGASIRSGELCDKCLGKADTQKSGYDLNRILHEDDRYRHF